MSPGYKFNEWEMKGVPIRIEVGQRDIDNNNIIIVRRDLNKKDVISITDSKQHIASLLDDIQLELFEQAQTFLKSNTTFVQTYTDFKSTIKKGGFVECGWDGNPETEKTIKKETKATIRCIPFEQKISKLKCVYTNMDAKYRVIFARAY